MKGMKGAFNVWPRKNNVTMILEEHIVGKKMEIEYNSGEKEDGIMLIKIRKFIQANEQKEADEQMEANKLMLANAPMLEFSWAQSSIINNSIINECYLQ